MMNLSSLSKAKVTAIGAMVTAVLSTFSGFAGGSLLRGARVINQAMKNVEEKMNGFVEVVNDFDVSLKDVVSEINSTVGTLEGVSKNMELTVLVK